MADSKAVRRSSGYAMGGRRMKSSRRQALERCEIIALLIKKIIPGCVLWMDFKAFLMVVGKEQERDKDGETIKFNQLI